MEQLLEAVGKKSNIGGQRHRKIHLFGVFENYNMSAHTRASKADEEILVG